MAKCPYDVGGTEQHADCLKFREATGFSCGVLRTVECEEHLAAGGWDVPLSKVPEFRRHLVARLWGILAGGNWPVEDAANRLLALTTKQTLEILLYRIAARWSAPGGHPISVVAEKLERLASIWNLKDKLTDWAERMAK